MNNLFITSQKGLPPNSKKSKPSLLGGNMNAASASASTNIQNWASESSQNSKK